MHINLNGGDWLFKGFVGEDWLWRNAHKPGKRAGHGWHTGCVPGSVMHDLWQTGQIADPYFERNSLLAEWAPQRTWVYKKRFTAGEALLGKRVRLVFEGVDEAARFFLNGEPLGEHRGMYTPAVFEVGDLLQYGGENLLAVVIDPAPFEQPQTGYSSRVRTHKSRMTYGWDFCPRLVHQGIWDAVYLDVTGLARLEGIWVRPLLSASLDRAEVLVSADLSARWPAHQPAGFPAEEAPGSRRFKAYPVEAELVAELRFEGRVIASQQAQCDIAYGGGRLNLSFDLDAPRLWWPNGHGEQALYEVDVRVMEPHIPGRAGSFESDRRRVTFGVRRLELVANEGAAPGALPYTFRVNGRRIYAKGWNWVPLDVMYGVERPEKLRRLLHLAQRAHVNLLRVWGGGLVEKEGFYDLCDRLGILVWQEFIQSSSGIENCPPEDPDFINELVAQAGQIIPRRRNHPCLALWCGGNELMTAPETPAGNAHPMLAALRLAASRLDPDRPWLPTSPSGPVFGSSLESIDRDPSSLHDVHGPWEHQGLSGQYELYNRGSSLFHSEFGVEGITNRKALDAVISAGHQQPVSLENPVWEHLGSWWVKEERWRELFGPLEDLQTLLQAAQFAQASGLGYAVEADRRRKYHNSGTLPWQFNEPYPMAACTSAVDYFAQPKPVYYAVAQAYAPLHVSAKFPTIAWAGREEFEAEIWASNSCEPCGYAPSGSEASPPVSGAPAAEVHLAWALTSPRGRVYIARRLPVCLPANAAARLAEVRFPLASIEEELFFLDLRLEGPDGLLLSQNCYLFSRARDLSPLFRAPETRLQVRRQALDGCAQVEIANAGEWTALFVWLEDARPLRAPGFVYFDANYFCLFPGESRSVRVDWEDVPPEDQRLTVKAWNTSAYELPE